MTLYSMDTLDGKRNYFPVTRYALNTSSPEQKALPATGQACDLFSNDTTLYTSTRLSYQKTGGLLGVTDITTPGGNVAKIYDTGNGKIILEAKNIASSEIDAIDRYRLLNIGIGSSIMIMYGIDWAYLPQYEKLREALNKYNSIVSKYPGLETYAATQANRQDNLYDVVNNFIFYLVHPSWQVLSYVDFLPLREIIVEQRSYVFNFYTQLAEDAQMNDSDKKAFISLGQIITEYAIFFDEDKFNELKFTVDHGIAGVNLNPRLTATVNNKYIYRLILFLNRASAQTNSFNCKITYKDGTSTTFTKSISVESAGWKYKEIAIDLNGFSNKENIQTLEVTIPDNYQYGIAIAILSPRGVEFEAISRDHFGRVFCKLNHLQQLERYEYDGPGRVIKVFDARGNMRQEFKYNEVATTN
jgi:hypothetical protein